MHGEKIQQIEDIAFNTLCNYIRKEIKIENWQENYTLRDEETKQEISTRDGFTNTIETAKKEKKMNMMLILQPKYKFIVCDETDSKEKEHVFSFMYFGESITTFKKVCDTIVIHFPTICKDDSKNETYAWQDKYDLMYENTNGNTNRIRDDASFNAMIREIKSTCKNKNDILLRLKTKV